MDPVFFYLELVQVIIDVQSILHEEHLPGVWVAVISVWHSERHLG